MTKEALKKIKKLCNSEIKFYGVIDNIVTILVPYDNVMYDIEIEGNTTNEQVESFISGVNQILDDMINHLEDCKL